MLNNLNENGFIDEKKLIKLKTENIKLKKRKIKLVNEANSYSEEVRRIIKENYGFKKLYAEGLSIKTPIDVNYQIYAQKALRNGIESYDKRQGWRGAITNKLDDVKWKKKLTSTKIDKTLNWILAEVIEIDNSKLHIEILEKKVKGYIFADDIGWAIKKNIFDNFKVGDIIFVKKNKDNWNLKQYPKVNGAIVVLDPYDGKVKALVGGFSYVSSEFNRATQAKRQPGSAFKPFVYAAALENGYLPNSIVLDAPFIIEQGVGLKNWKPENYGKKFYGPSTLRKGIEYSRNLMTVRISESLGLNEILDLSKKLEIYNDIPELLSVSLGSAETTLINISSAYASFANGGKKIKPILIDRIQDRRGKTIFNSDNRECLGCDHYSEDSEKIPMIKNNYEQVFSEETAYQMTSILEGVIKRGTGKKLKNLKMNLAGKTGTTNENTDAWFIGFTSNLVIGVYVGMDNPKPLGKFETGSKTALPIFEKFVKNSVKKNDARPFKVSDGITMMVVDPLTGQKASLSSKNTIVEAYKSTNVIDGKVLYSNNNRLDSNNILKFY